jgi:DNA-binding Xre family transcriptional regulator
MSKYIRSNLAYLRAIRGKVSQSIVSGATGIAQKTLSALETGVSQGIEFNTLIKLCTFFKCTPNDLLVLEDVPDYTVPSSKSLKKADKIIAQGLKAAMNAPLQTPEEIWTEFEQIRARLQESSNKRTRVSSAIGKRKKLKSA